MANSQYVERTQLPLSGRQQMLDNVRLGGPERVFDGISDEWISRCSSMKSIQAYDRDIYAARKKHWHSPMEMNEDKMPFNSRQPERSTPRLGDVGAAASDVAGKIGGLVVGGAGLLAAPFVNKGGPALGSEF